MDTDVIVSAFISPEGASRRLLLEALKGNVALLLSTPLLVEYESVLHRKEQLSKGRATDAEVTEILDALAGVCVPVVFDYSWRPTGSHPEDELVIETAICGNADALATFNLKDMRDATRHFGIHAGRPGPLLERVRR